MTICGGELGMKYKESRHLINPTRTDIYYDNESFSVYSLHARDSEGLRAVLCMETRLPLYRLRLVQGWVCFLH